MIEISETARRLFLILGTEVFAFVLAFACAKPFIKLLKKFKIRKQIREKATTGEKAKLFHKLHEKKSGTLKKPQ